MNSETQYINRIVDTALFFFETLEGDDGGGSTQIIKLIKPVPSISNIEFRSYVLNENLRKGSTLTSAALNLSHWIRARNLAPFPIINEESKVSAACGPYERPLLPSHCLHPDRPYRRLARHIWRMQSPDVGKHSRVFDFYIPAQSIQRGRSVNAPAKGFHPEHVVPCAEILRICLGALDKLSDGAGIAPEEASVAQLVPLIKRLLRIVKIDESERKRLDEGTYSALKDKMPTGWTVETGCIFQRLHTTEIELELLSDGSHLSHQSHLSARRKGRG